MILRDIPILPYRLNNADGLLTSLVHWLKSSEHRCEQTAYVVLTLICLTTIFSTAIVQILVVAQIFVVLWFAESLPSFEIRRTPLDVPYLAFIIARLASVAFSQDPEKSLPAISIEFFFYIVFFLLTQSIQRDEFLAARILVSVIIWAGVIAGAIGVFKVFLAYDARASSTTAGTYTLGTYLCPVLCLALFSPNLGHKVRGGKWLPPLIICLGIIFTFDRLHWVAMALILAIAGLLSPRRKMTVALCVLLIGSLLLPSIRGRALQMANLESLMSGRDVLWNGAMLLIAKHPFLGFGPRTFSEIFPHFELLPFRGVGSWHNDYLQVYMESGLVGLIPLIWLVIATVISFWRSLRAGALTLENRRMIFSLFFAVGLIFLVGGILDTLVGILFRILLGLLGLCLASVNRPPPLIKRTHEASAPTMPERESVR